MFSPHTSLGVKFIFACECLGLSVPEVGHVGIWFVDNLYTELDHVEGIQRDTDYQASLGLWLLGICFGFEFFCANYYEATQAGFFLEF
jgi:hypothetical protein